MARWALQWRIAAAAVLVALVQVASSDPGVARVPEPEPPAGAPPASPQLLTAVPGSLNDPTVDLTWQLPGSSAVPTGFEIQRKTATTEFSRIATHTPTSAELTQSQFTFTDSAANSMTAVTPRVEHSYQVIATNAHGSSLASNVLSTTWYGPGPLFTPADFEQTPYRFIQGRPDTKVMPIATRGTGAITYTVEGAATAWLTVVQNGNDSPAHISSSPYAAALNIPSGRTRTATFRLKATDSQGRTDLSPELTATLEPNYTPEYADANPSSTLFIVGDEVDFALAPLPSPANLPLTVTVSGLHTQQSGLRYDAATHRITGTASLIGGSPHQREATLYVGVRVDDADGERSVDVFLIEIEVDSVPFGLKAVLDKQWTVGWPVTVPLDVRLPEAQGGNGDLTYSLTPALPDGVTRSPDGFQLRGVPTSESAAQQYTWAATDADGDTVSRQFSIAVGAAMPVGQVVGVTTTAMLGGTVIRWEPMPNGEWVSGFRVERQNRNWESPTWRTAGASYFWERFVVDSDFPPNGDYYYRVIAMRGDQEGPPSAAVAANALVDSNDTTHTGPRFTSSFELERTRRLVAGRDTWTATGGVVLVEVTGGTPPYSYETIGGLPRGTRFVDTSVGPRLLGEDSITLPSDQDRVIYTPYVVVTDANDQRAVSRLIWMEVERNFRPVLQAVPETIDVISRTTITPIPITVVNQFGTASHNGPLRVTATGLHNCYDLRLWHVADNNWEIRGFTYGPDRCDLRVRVVDHDGETAETTFTIRVNGAPGWPRVPRDVAATAVGATEVELTWTAAPQGSARVTNLIPEIAAGAAAGGPPIYHHLIEYATGAGGPEADWQRLAQVPYTQTSFRHTGLTAGTQHHYRVISKSRWLNSTPSGSVSVTTVAGPPGVVGELEVTRGTRQLEVAWLAPTDDGGSPITEYVVEYAEYDGSDAMVFVALSPILGPATNATIPNLLPRTRYLVRVAARNAFGLGPRSPTVERDIGNSPPSFVLPEGVEQHVALTRQVNENVAPLTPIGDPFVAMDPDGDSVQLVLARARFGHLFTLLPDGRLATNANVHLDFENLQGAPWCHCSEPTRERDSVAVVSVPIQAVDSFGGVTHLSVRMEINDVDEAPSPPTSIAVATIGPTATIAWEPPDNAGRPPISGYNVEYQAIGSGTPAWVNVPVSGTATSVTVAEAPSGSFAVRVRSVNHEGVSEWTAVRNLIRFGPPVFSEGPLATRQVTENAPAGTSVGAPVTATDPNGDALLYSLPLHQTNQFAISADGQITVGTNAALDYESFHGQAAEVNLLVRAIDPNGDVGEITVRIEILDDREELPLPPAAPVLQSSDDHTITVAWTAPDNAGRPPLLGYRLQYRELAQPTTDVWETVPLAVATATTATISDLTADLSYEFRVSAWNADGNGPPSSVLVVRRNSPPAFASAYGSRITRQVAEGVWESTITNAPRGYTQLGAPIEATDPNGDAITFSLVSDERTSIWIWPPREYLTIDRISGQVSLGPGNWFDAWEDNYDGAAPTFPARLIIVRATDEHGAFSEIEFEVDVRDVAEPPLVMPAPSVKEFTADSAVLSWPKPANINRPRIRSYELGYRVATTADWSVQTVGVNPLLNDDETAVYGLQASTGYEYRVRAWNKDGWGPWSETVADNQRTAPVDSIVAPTISIRVLENTAAGTVVGQIAWVFADLGQIDGYQLNRRSGDESTDAIPFAVDSTGQLTVAENAELDWETAREHPFNLSGLRNSVAQRTVPISFFIGNVRETPDPIGAPTVTAVAPDSLDSFAAAAILQVSWSDPVRWQDEVGVRYKPTAGSDWTLLGPYTWRNRTPLISGLDGGIEYEVQVRVITREGRSEWSPSGTATTLTGALQFANGQSMAVSWAENTEAPAGPLGGTWGDDSVIRLHSEFNVGDPIRILPRTNSGTETAVTWSELTWSLAGADAAAFSLRRSIPDWRADVDSNAVQLLWRTFVKQDYESKPQYAVEVVANDRHGGRAVLPVTVTITDVAEPPFQPLNVSVTAITISGLQLGWEIIEGDRPPVTSMEVQYWPLADGAAATQTPATDSVVTLSSLSATTRSQSITGLDAGQRYVFQVRAHNDEGTGEWSSRVTVTTVANGPPVFANAPSVTFAVAENTHAAEPVGVPIVATSPDGTTPSLRLDGELVLAFTIGADGQIATREEFDYDHEAKSSYVGHVIASNGNGAASLPVTIEVVDVSEPPGPVTGLQITERGYDHLTMTWTAPDTEGRPPVTTYEFRRTVGGTTIEISTSELDGTTATFRELTPDTLYTFAVRGINEEGTGTWSDPAQGRTLQNKPTPVFAEGLRASRPIAENAAAGTAAGVPVAATQAGGYSLTYYLLGAINEGFTIEPRTGQIRTKIGAVIDYEARTTYIGAVYAVNGDTSSSISVAVEVSDVAEPPLMPVFATVSTTESSATLRWSAIDNRGRPAITGYGFERRDSATATPVAVAPTRLIGAEATFGSLTAAQDYWFRVRAVNDEGDGAWSAWVQITTSSTPETVVPPGLIPPEGTIVHRRSIPEDVAAGVKLGDLIPSTTRGTLRESHALYFRGQPASVRPPFSVDPWTTQVRTIANANYDYESTPTYHLVLFGAFDVAGTTAVNIERLWLNITVTDVDEPPSAPTGLTIAELQPDSLSIRWTAPDTSDRPDISAYHFRRREGGSGNGDLVTPTQEGLGWARFGGLASDHEYEFAVRATNDEGMGEWSAWVFGRTLVQSLPPPVFAEGVSATREVPENASANLAVGAPVAATQAGGEAVTYDLLGILRRKFSMDPDTGQLRTLAGVDYNFEAAQSYEGVVLASNGSTSTSIRLVVQVVDDAEPPGRPVSLTLSDPATDAITLSWVQPDPSGHPPITRYEFTRSSFGGGQNVAVQPIVQAGLSPLLDNKARFDQLDDNTRYYFRMRAVNDEGAGPWSDSVLSYTLTAQSAEPVPTDDTTWPALTLNVPENTVGGVAVGEPIPGTAADPSKPLTYYLRGVLPTYFDIDSATGQIRTKPNVDYDHETDSSYFGGVTIAGNSGTPYSHLTIYITDVAEPPLAPLALAAGNRQATRFTLSWDAPNNDGRPYISGHAFEYREFGTDAATAITPEQVDRSRAYFSGLTPETAYDFRVRAVNDEGSGAWSDWLTVRTTAMGVEFDSATALRSLSEGAGGGEAVGEPIVATNNGAQRIAYYLVGAARHAFSIDLRSGQLRTRPGVEFDYESQQMYAGTVYVTDGVASDSLQLTVQVTDVDEPSEPPLRLRIAEVVRTSLALHWTVPVNADRPPANAYEFEMRSGGTSTPFTPAVEELHSAQIIGLTPNTHYDFRVRALNAEGASEWTDWVGERTLQFLPTFGESTAVERRVDENTLGNVGVGEPVLATYSVGGELRYGLSGTVREAFWIDEVSGQIRTRQRTVYDHESMSVYSGHVVVEVVDQGQNIDQLGTQRIELTIHVDDVEEPPGAPEHMRLLLGPTNARLTWVPADNTGRPVVTRYEFERRTGASGTFAGVAPPTSGDNYAQFDSLQAGTEYGFRVRAVNDEGTSAWSAVVSGTTVASPPVFVEGSAIMRRLAEDPAGDERPPHPAPVGDPVAAVSAASGTVTYALVGEAAGYFTIGPSTGQIYTRPRSTHPSGAEGYDHEGQATYAGTVTATLGSISSQADLQIVITDVDEPPDPPSTYLVRSREGETVTITWLGPFGMDRPAPHSRPPLERFEFGIRAGDASDFESVVPDQLTGTTATFANLHPNLRYSFRIRSVSAEGAGAWTPTFDTTRVDDRPRFAEGEKAVRAVAENTRANQPVGAPVTAIDSNPAQLVYGLRGAVANSFTVDRRTGQLRTRPGATYDHEATSVYHGSMYVRDGGLFSRILLEIRVSDVDEPPAAPTGLSVVNAQAMRLTIGWTAGVHPDRPAVTGFEFRQRLAGGRSFANVTPATVGDDVATIGSLQPSTSYEFQVRAVNDEGASGWSATVTGQTAAGAATPIVGAPVPTAPDLVDVVRRIPENTPAGTAIGSALSDLLPNPATFYITAGRGSGIEIVADTGQLRMGRSAVLDFEAQERHVLTVVATDRNGDESQLAVTVFVEDVAEPPPAPGAPSLEGAGTSGLTVVWPAPDVTGRPEITGYEVEYRTIGARTYTAAAVDSIRGERATLSGLVANTVYLFRVRATNAEGTGPWTVDGLGGTLAVEPGVVISSRSAEVVSTTTAEDVGTSTVTERNFGPVFPAQSVTLRAANAAAAGTRIGEPVLATDRNADDTLTYELGGDDAAMFVIDPVTAQISVGDGGLDSTIPTDGYTLIVSVTDGRDVTGEPDPSTDATTRVHVTASGSEAATSGLLVAHALSAGSGSAPDVTEPPPPAAVTVAVLPRTLSQLSEHVANRIGSRISDRFTVTGERARVTIAGRSVNWSGVPDDDGLALDRVASPFDRAAEGESWGGDRDDLLRGTRFETPVNLDGVTAAATRWSIWGSGEELSLSDSHVGGVDWTTEQVDLSHVGVEARRGSEWLFGVVFSQGGGELKIDADGEELTADWRGVGMHPYARWSPTAHSEAWGIVGIQSGELHRTGSLPTTAQSQLVAVGADHAVHSHAGFTLGVSGRAQSLRVHTDSVANAADSTVDHVDDAAEINLHGVGELAGIDASLVLHGSIGVRTERTGSHSGSATRVAGGIRHAGLPWGWELDATAEHAEVLAGDDRFGNLFEVSLLRRSSPDQRGFAAELSRRWSDVENADTEAEWWRDVGGGLADESSDTTAEWRASLSFGTPLPGGRQSFIPYAAVSGEPAVRRDLRIGLKLDPIPRIGVWQLDLFGERSHDGDDSESKVGVDAAIRF